jgi:hypothetical protein
MTPGQRAEWEAGVRSLYDGMVRVVVTPTWAKLIDFETTLPTAIEELMQQQKERHGDAALVTHATFGESMKIQARNVVRFRLGMAMLAANRGEPAEVLNQSSTFSPVTAATSSADSRSWRLSGRSCATSPTWPTASRTCYGTRRFRCRGTSRRRSARSASGARPATFLASHKGGTP